MTSAVERLAEAALVPGLRQECPVHESTRIGHKTLGDPLQEYPCHAKCSGCQGRGWTLIPEAEQIGVMVLEAEHFSLIKNTDGTWTAHIITDNLESVTCLEDTPEEALASAICQAKGIET